MLPLTFTSGTPCDICSRQPRPRPTSMSAAAQEVPQQGLESPVATSHQGRKLMGKSHPAVLISANPQRQLAMKVHPVGMDGGLGSMDAMSTQKGIHLYSRPSALKDTEDDATEASGKGHPCVALACQCEVREDICEKRGCYGRGSNTPHPCGTPFTSNPAHYFWRGHTL